MNDRVSREPNAAVAESPSVPRWAWPATAAVLGVLFLIRLTFAVSHVLADGGTRIGIPVFEEITGILLGAPAVVILVVLVLRYPLYGPSWRRAAFVIVLAFVPLSLAHTWLLVVLRATIGPWFGFTQFDFGVPAARFAYEGMTDLVHSIAIGGGFTAARVIGERRARERRALSLERALLDAELRTLRLRLEPHFLFNALNTVASTMYADVAAADAQLGHLSALLRAALRTTDTQEVTLDEELALLEHYLAIVRARFEDRLDVRLAITPEAKRCLVPSLLLQPLVENAIRHGAVEQRGRGVVTVSAQVQGHTLRVRVHDDGPGLPPGRDALDAGTGVSATVQRLRLLYGDGQSVAIGNVPGGFEVAITMPARVAPAPRTRSSARSTVGAR